jgi:hypothetical protein
MFDYDAGLKQVIEMAVAHLNSEEIRATAELLPVSQSEAVILFCHRFDLGAWLEESLISYEIDIRDTLYAYAEEVQELEAEETLENSLIEQSLRLSQGWAV